MSAQRLFPGRLHGRHVLIGLTLFFGLMFAANGVFVYYAVGTFNGFETANAYRRGLNYNQRIADDADQAARGWKGTARYDASGGRLLVEMRDKEGRAVAGLSVSGQVRRPVTDRQDRLVQFSETVPGRYEALANLSPGQWIVIAEAAGADLSVAPYRLKQRLWIKGKP